MKSYLTKLLKFIKNLSFKKKIYISIGFILFFLSFFYGEYSFPFIKADLRYIFLVSIFGIIFSVRRRIKNRKEINEKSLTSIVLNDYSFSSYASLSLLSLIYTISQGFLLGSATGFLFYGVNILFYPNTIKSQILDTL